MIDLPALAGRLLRGSGAVFEKASFILLDRSRAGDTSVALLAFLDDDRAPRAFIKATPDAARTGRLEREYENLNYLHRHGSVELRRALPVPLDLGRGEGMAVLAETAVGGTRMKDLPPDAYFNSSAFLCHLALVVRWLVELYHCGAAAPPEPLDAAAAVARYRERYRVSTALHSLLEDCARRLQGFSGPAPLWHGDFCTANVLVEGDEQLAVIDWEYPLVPGWPFADLLYFLASTWGVPYGRGRKRLLDNYRTLFFEDHPLRAPLRDALVRYALALRLPEDLRLSLAVLAWVAHANRKSEELATLGATAGSGSSHMPLVMIEEGSCLNLELLAAQRERFLLP